MKDLPAEFPTFKKQIKGKMQWEINFLRNKTKIICFGQTKEMIEAMCVLYQAAGYTNVIRGHF